MRNIKTLLTYDEIEEDGSEITWSLFGVGSILYSVDPDVSRGKDFCVRVSSVEHSEAFTTWQEAESHLVKQIQRMMNEAISEIESYTKQYLALSKRLG